MIEVVGICFENNSKVYYFSPNGLKIKKGINVIVKTEKGLQFGTVAMSNILVDEKGKPFLIDIDDIVTIPSIEEFYQQSQYLTEFILNIYLEEYQTLRMRIGDKEIRRIFSEKAIAYMENLTVIANPIPNLPYILLDELKDEEKVLKLKKQIILNNHKVIKGKINDEVYIYYNNVIIKRE